MLRTIRHSLLCFPRRRCDCVDDSAQPNRPREVAPANQPQAGSGGTDSSEDENSSDDGYPPAPPPSEVSLSDKISHTGITGADSSEDENSSDDGYPPAPPPSEVSLSDKISHTGITGADSSEDENSSDDGYPPAPPPSEVSLSDKISHTGITGSDSSEDENSSDDGYPPAPPPSEVSLSDKTSHTAITPPMSVTNIDDDSSLGDDPYSLSTRNSQRGITPATSDAGLNESQYNSLPESGESHQFVSAGEHNTDEYDYNGADEDSLDLGQDDDEEMYDPDEDEEMYEDPAESEEPESTSQEWPSDPSDRRRRRSLDNQSQADAEHRGLYGSRGGSASNKRQRLEGSTDTSSGRVRTGLEPTTKDVTRYRKIGARYQAWIDDPQAPGCRIKPATLTIEEMTDEAQSMPWAVDESYFAVEPIALEGGDVESMNIARGGPRWRYTYLRRDPGPKASEANEFEHRVTRGVLVAEKIYREDGPHWNEVARAQYLLDYNLKTLRHVIFTDVSNEETAPYIRDELYPRRGVIWSQAQSVDCMVFKHGSAEYQELLGTKLGKATACLVLSSFPRGTMKITRIVTWCNSTAPQMRFEIEPVVV